MDWPLHETPAADLPETIRGAEAIGALLVGLVLAAPAQRPRIEHLVIPSRDF
jgi:hypothetical protein